MLKKSIPLLFLSLLLWQGLKAQKKVAPPWPGVPYTSVKVFLYNLDNQLYGQYQAWKDGKPNMSISGNGTTLEPEQVKKLEAIINGDTRVLNEGLAKCYEPHHAVFFYDQQGNIVAAFDVCFLCEGIRFYPSKNYSAGIKNYSESLIKKAQQQLEDIKTVFTGAGIPVFDSQRAVSDYTARMETRDTLQVTCNAPFSPETTLFYTSDEIKELLNDYVYDTVFAFDNNQAAITEYRYRLGGPKIGLDIFCKGSDCFISKIETTVRTSFFKGPFNIGMTRTALNRLLYPYTGKYFYNKTVLIKDPWAIRSVLIHFNEDKQADSIILSNH